MKKKLINKLLIFVILVAALGCYIKYYNSQNTLSIMIWYGVIDNETIRKFEKKYNIKVNLKYYYSNEELISKLQISSDDVDIIFPSDYAIHTLMSKGLIQPINTKKIHHFKDLSPKLLENIIYNKKYFGIPYAWSAFGIAADEELCNDIGKGIATVDWYKIFFTGEYKNKNYKIGGINDFLTVINVAYHYYKQNFKKNKIYSKTNLLNIIQEILKAQYPHVRVYMNSEHLDQLFTNHMINLTLIQSADFLRIMNQHPDLPFKFFVPHYYNLLVCEYLAITNSAKNTDACYLFINFLLEKEQLEDMTKKNFWFHPRKDLKLGDSPLYNQIASDTEKNKNKSYYTDTLLNKKEILTLIMNLKS